MRRSAIWSNRNQLTESKNVLHRNAAQETPFFNTTQSFFRPRYFGVQPKLTVNAPDDVYEKEADAVADKVMRMPDPQVQRQPMEEEEEEIQMKEQALGIQRKCKECEEKEEKLQKKPLIMKQEKNKNGQARVSPTLHPQLSRTKGGGTPLPPTTNEFMSRAIGVDFSNVRIYTGHEAIQINKRLQARAFTHGRDIYFNKGQYKPKTKYGKKLLAHELVHVIQQRGWQSLVQRKTVLSFIDESEGCRLADRETRGRIRDFALDINNTIDDWRDVAFQQIVDFLQDVLIETALGRTEQLRTVLPLLREARAETGLALLGNLAFFMGLVAELKPLATAVEIGVKLIEVGSTFKPKGSRTTNVPQFLDEIGGLKQLVEKIREGSNKQFKEEVERRKRKAGEGLCRIAGSPRFSEFSDRQIQEGLIRGIFPELGGVPTDFSGAVAEFTMRRLQGALSILSEQARAAIREESPDIVEALSEGQISETDLTRFMRFVGISETAAMLESRARGVKEEGRAPREKFVQEINHPDFKVKLSAVLGIGKFVSAGDLDPSRTIPVLMVALKDEEETVRAVAAVALASLKNPLVIPNIIDVLNKTRNKSLRRAIQSGLEKLGQEAVKPRPVVTPL